MKNHFLEKLFSPQLTTTLIMILVVEYPMYRQYNCRGFVFGQTILEVDVSYNRIM